MKDLKQIIKTVIHEYLNEGLNEIIMRPPFEPKHDSSPNMDSFEKIIKHSFEDAKNNGKKIDSIDIGFTNHIYNLNKPDMHDNYKLFILEPLQTILGNLLNL